MKNSTAPTPTGRRNGAAAFIAAALSVAALVSVDAAGPKSPTPTKEASHPREIVVPVEGMSCVVCVARVKKEIAAMPGVVAVNVDLAERNARISYDPKRVSPQQLAAAIDKLGFKAGEPKDAPPPK